MGLADRYPGRETLIKLDVASLPPRNLPPIRHFASSPAYVHPGHLLIPGRTQALTIAPYTFIQPKSFSAAPITCYPQGGYIWVTKDILRAIHLYSSLIQAYCSGSANYWNVLWWKSIDKLPMSPRYPALWTPTLAAADARSGAVLELIHYSTKHRFYAVITELIVTDPFHALFYAQLLGTLTYSECSTK